MCAVHHVVATNASSRLTSSRRDSRAEGHLDAVEHAREPAVGLDLLAPDAGSGPTGSTVTMRTRRAALRQPASEVELRDVAAEEVRRGRSSGSSRFMRCGRVVADREPQRRDLLLQHAQRRCRRAARRARVERRRRHARPAAAPRAGRAAPERASSRRHANAASSIHSAPSVSGRARPARVRRSPPAAPSARRGGPRPRRKRPARAAAARHAVAAAQLEHGRELDQPPGVDEVVRPPQPHAVARAAAQRAEPVAQRRSCGGRGVSERGARRAGRSRTAGGRRSAISPSASATEASQ